MRRALEILAPEPKGKPTERWGRKATGLKAKAHDSGAAGIAQLMRYLVIDNG